jgi:hypothetical protein
MAGCSHFSRSSSAHGAQTDNGNGGLRNGRITSGSSDGGSSGSGCGGSAAATAVFGVGGGARGRVAREFALCAGPCFTPCEPLVVADSAAALLALLHVAAPVVADCLARPVLQGHATSDTSVTTRQQKRKSALPEPEALIATPPPTPFQPSPSVASGEAVMRLAAHFMAGGHWVFGAGMPVLEVYIDGKSLCLSLCGCGWRGEGLTDTDSISRAVTA